MATEFTIDGFDHLDKALSSLDKKIQKKVTVKALREGAKIIRKAARDKAPTDDGTLKKSIAIRVVKGPLGTKQVVVYTKKGKSEKYDAFYSHMVEFGTAHSRAQPFLRPAAEEKAKEAIDAVGAKLGELIKELTE